MPPFNITHDRDCNVYQMGGACDCDYVARLEQNRTRQTVPIPIMTLERWRESLSQGDLRIRDEIDKAIRGY